MSLRSQIEDLAAEHGDDAVRAALQFLPRIIALIKAGKLRRITAALDEAHAAIDEMGRDRRRIAEENERRVRADEPTVASRIRDAGEAG